MRTITGVNSEDGKPFIFDPAYFLGFDKCGKYTVVRLRRHILRVNRESIPAEGTVMIPIDESTVKGIKNQISEAKE